MPPKALRISILLLVAAETAFLVALGAYIARRANPMGDGMEFLALGAAVMMIYLPLSIPALLLAFTTRLLRVGLALAVAAAVVDVIFFFQVASELGPVR